MKRILFLLDASGSMNGKWGEDTKFEIARNILLDIADSIQATGDQVEMGIRIFGHQFHKDLNNCEDSRLEVNFTNKPGVLFSQALANVEPKGNTPIAYSLYLSIQDFAEDVDALNSIILITDGIENCDGDPCDAAELLSKKRITINPFIIGLDIADSLHKKFECIGTFLEAKDEASFNEVVHYALEKATSKTTVEINLLSGSKRITNLPITFYDHYNDEILYQFVHTSSMNGGVDTLYHIDPKGSYDIRVHTYPPVTRIDYRLDPGEHNIINMSVSSGELDVKYILNYDDRTPRFAVMEAFERENVLSGKITDQSFITRDYTTYINTYPVTEVDLMHISENLITEISIPQNGRLLLENNGKILATLFQVVQNGEWKFVEQFESISGNYRFPVLPGKYALLYIESDNYEMEQTKMQQFLVEPGKTTVIQLP